MMINLSTRKNLLVGGCSHATNYIKFLNQQYFQRGYHDVWDYENKKIVQQPLTQQEEFAIWPERLADMMDMNLINVATNGVGNYAIYCKILDQLAQNIHIDFVFVAWSDWSRYDVEIDGQWQTAATRNDRKMFGDLIHDVDESVNSFYRFSYSLQQICKSLNIPLYQFQSTHPLRPSYNHFIRKFSVSWKNLNWSIVEKFYHHTYFEMIDKEKFIGWPIFTELQDILNVDAFSGWSINKDIKYQIGKFDGHWNKQGNDQIFETIKTWMEQHD